MNILDIKPYTPNKFKGLRTWTGTDQPQNRSRLGKVAKKVKSAFSGSGSGYLTLF